MATSRDRISPQEFQGAIKRLTKATYRTSYVPKKVDDAVKQAGAGRFRWQSATRRQVERTVGSLQAQKVFKASKQLTPKRIFQDILEERATAETENTDVPMAATKLPGRLSARQFVEYYGKATGHPEHVKATLIALGLPTGAKQAEHGAEAHLNQRQMTLVLNQLRETGKLTHRNIGAAIARSHRRTQVLVQAGIAGELSEQAQRRYNAAAREDLPEGSRRSIGRPAAESALRSATDQQRSSSVSRAGRAQPSDETAAHATTASALARRAAPDAPKTSITRKSRGNRPAAQPDLPDLSFDLE